MAGLATKERLQQDIAVWFADGIIDQQTLHLLRDRYQAERFGLTGIIKYLGIGGGLLAFFGILGLVAALSESLVLAVMLLGGLGAGITHWGLRMAANIRDRYASSSKVVLTLGVVLWTAAVALGGKAIDLDEGNIVTATGVLCLPVTFLLAYRSRNTYLLILALLEAFHWLGAWNSMWGRSAYVFAIQDPKAMCVAALAAIAIGMYHERQLYPKTGRFYLAWESLGLLYLNTSLLILSIWQQQYPKSSLWVVVMTAACIGQIVLGSAWKNNLIRNFGIVFFAIDLFTRYHEWFWNRLALGEYLLAGGALLFAVGGGTEMAIHALRKQGRAR